MPEMEKNLSLSFSATAADNSRIEEIRGKLSLPSSREALRQVWHLLAESVRATSEPYPWAPLVNRNRALRPGRKAAGAKVEKILSFAVSAQDFETLIASLKGYGLAKVQTTYVTRLSLLYATDKLPPADAPETPAAIVQEELDTLRALLRQANEVISRIEALRKEIK